MFARNFWKTFCDFLIWCILNFARGNFAPALNPASTEMTFAIPNHERFRWQVGNAELFFHEIEVDRALRRAMLLKLLLGIPSAVEESLTSQGRVALFFTHRLRLEYHDRIWSRRLRCAPLRMTKEKTLPRPARDRKDLCLCASRDRLPKRCIFSRAIRRPGPRRCAVRDFFGRQASGNPTT